MAADGSSARCSLHRIRHRRRSPPGALHRRRVVCQRREAPHSISSGAELLRTVGDVGAETSGNSHERRLALSSRTPHRLEADHSQQLTEGLRERSVRKVEKPLDGNFMRSEDLRRRVARLRHLRQQRAHVELEVLHGC